MEPAEYIEETSNAVQQLFDGLAFYNRILREDPRPVFVTSVSPDDEEAWRAALDQWHEENKPQIVQSLAKQREYLGYTFSQATLAGAVLQIASMGISLFSTNTEVPAEHQDIAKPESKGAKYCIGRIVNGVPIGLVILAARNQYNHWDDPQPHRLTKQVFEKLANASGRYTDPALDLANSRLSIHSHNVISLLGWTNYEAYLQDIAPLLGRD